MKTMNKTATKILLSLIEGLNAGDARRIDNAKGAFMAVSVDVLREEGYSKLVAVAHRYEQNGDLVPDPDVEFLVVSIPMFDGVETRVYSTAIDQAFGYRREVELDGLRVTGYRPRGQADLTAFCNLWMKNIKAQQGDLTPAPAPTHGKDADCDVDPATDTCRTCGVGHGDPCPACGGRAFHLDGCQEVRAAA